MANNIIIQFTEFEFRELLKSCIAEGMKENAQADQEVSNKLFNVKEAATFLNLAPQTLYGFTSNRTIPFIKKGKKLYFKKSDLEVWLTDGKKETIAEIANSFDSKRKGGKQ